MKKHILLGTALASLFALGACDYNEDNFPGFDEKETITDVSTDTLVLADAHYGKIASMPKNQGIALAKDPEGQTYLTALNQLGKTKMFTDMVAPEDGRCVPSELRLVGDRAQYRRRCSENGIPESNFY